MPRSNAHPTARTCARSLILFGSVLNLVLAGAASAASDPAQPTSFRGTADILWMTDISSYTSDDRGVVAAAAPRIFQRLTAAGIDFRVGVVPHTENHYNTGSYATAGDMWSGFHRNLAGFQWDLNYVENTTGCTFGLTAIDDAIQKALPRTPTGTEDPTKLRTGAKLIVFYISDKHAQEIEENSNCTPTATGTGVHSVQVADDLTPQEHLSVDQICSPFITRIRNQGGVAFGQVDSCVGTPKCLHQMGEDGTGYIEVIRSTGGMQVAKCDSVPNALIDAMIAAILHVAGVQDPGPEAGLALAEASPNPARQGLRAAFDLPTRADASIALFDVGGRLVWSRTLDGMPPGRHDVQIGRDPKWAPGVYLMRLTQGGRAVSRRVVFSN